MGCADIHDSRLVRWLCDSGMAVEIPSPGDEWSDQVRRATAAEDARAR